jgi:hypothetical protein
MRQSDAERDEAIKHLRKMLKPGSTVYTVLRNVSRGGTSRDIDVYMIHKGELVFLSGWVGKAIGLKRHPKRDGLTIQGGGMDMGFEIVYSLGHVLFPKGFKVTPKTIHRNGTPNGELDKDGGYALRHQWI